MDNNTTTTVHPKDDYTNHATYDPFRNRSKIRAIVKRKTKPLSTNNSILIIPASIFDFVAKKFMGQDYYNDEHTRHVYYKVVSCVMQERNVTSYTDEYLIDNGHTYTILEEPKSVYGLK